MTTAPAEALTTASPLARVLQAAMDVDNLWHQGKQDDEANRALCDALDRYWLALEETAWRMATGQQSATCGQ